MARHRDKFGCGSIAKAAIFAVAVLLTGCADSLSYEDLPALKSERPLLTPEQQAKAMADLIAKKDAETAAAIRHIEQRK